MFNALIVNKNEEGKTSAAVEQITLDDLPAGDVTVAVEYSTVNYKDGLCSGPGGGLGGNYPHIPCIGFGGPVAASGDAAARVGAVGESAEGRLGRAGGFGPSHALNSWR